MADLLDTSTQGASASLFKILIGAGLGGLLGFSGGGPPGAAAGAGVGVLVTLLGNAKAVAFLLMTVVGIGMLFYLFASGNVSTALIIGIPILLIWIMFRRK